MACHLFGAKPLPQPVLFFVNWTIGNKFQWDRNRNSYIVIHENAIKNIVSQIGGHFAQVGDELNHWGRVTHICVSKLTIIGSDNGLSPGRRQAIIWSNAGILLIWTLGTNFSEILSEIRAFSFKKMHLKMSSAKWRPFCLGLNVLTRAGLTKL